MASFTIIIDYNNDLQNSHKYRGIALSAICTNVFEYIILELYGHLLTSSELQFAYKSKTSTTQCAWMAREVISYYNNNGSGVYACLLDCSKAFDCVRHDKQLQKLMSTGLLPIIIRSLMYMYSNSKIQVKWKDLRSQVMGAELPTNYYGCVGYADDLKLLCPGLKGLQRMLNICNEFSCSNGLIFNAT